MEDRLRSRIDPELLRWYDASPGFDFDNLEDFVEKMNTLELEALREDPAVRTWEETIPGPQGAPSIKLRCYAPQEGTGPAPGLLFFHGGGFLFGSVYRQESLCQRYVKAVGCVVISVEYRLAPKWKAPAPVEDAYAALLWVHENAASIGVDPTRLAAAGLSAGGTITAALAMMARDRNGPKLCLQMPLYGELDWHLETPSSQEITSQKVWCYENNRTSWDLYLCEDKAVDYYDAPALCRNLRDLPPAFSFVGELDPVRDENMAFWARLLQAGIPVECHVFPGAFHCFELGVPEARISQKAYELSYAALRRAFYG
ncbi:MAG: lipase [Firmicutes bacterium]|nr:lipase [Bacillota bacterium]